MIRIENLSKSYADKTLLDQLTYHFPQGQRIALVGANGQGKTTLLNILTGRESANSGKVICPKSLRLGYLNQSASSRPEPSIREECMAGHEELYSAHKQMSVLLEKMAVQFHEADYEVYEGLLKLYENNNGYQLEGNAEKILLGLGFTTGQLDQSPLTLSGGWRMRLELAKTLLNSPDFLILDEPTNHLDLPSIEWLEEYLQSFRNTLLFVSHDRSFLNNVATTTAYLKHGKLQVFKGNFDDFLDQKEQTQKTEAATLKKVLQRQAHMQSFVDRFRGTPSKAKQVGSRQKSISKLRSALEGTVVEGAEAKIHIPQIPFTNSGKEVFTLKHLAIGYEAPLLKDLDFIIQRGKKVAIVGKNGIGKSTLLKTLNGSLKPLAGSVGQGHNVQIGFYNQNAAEDMVRNQTVFQTLQNANIQLSDQTLRALLGMMLFKGHDMAKMVSVLSGGERSRLAICCLLAQAPNCLLLDEPTNHLDLISTQLLANMLQEYKGTVVFVSHDRDFIEQVSTSVIEIDGRKAILWEKD
ncbi:ABC-F family ATP-binding cassette domain-containing protein [Candidatus Finniella inopinata]|uniref:ABC-F family ATP-binding cassette domain-containing protein n=1 Tax=Candidatus Finniella inopinata TaxID=1696036 RepID=A0A4Q7DKI3_9PROT|nr:ABC-F family ATP-binding cassette domain-containing protein [Candidatus Finniella inopinata]RZI45186.1 ABC-F family ATP-binding cassette domain-containing protein [Candidatus Finniella inopinata]